MLGSGDVGSAPLAAAPPPAGGTARLDPEFLCFHYKVDPCMKPFSHDWASCHCGHPGERAARRCPRTVGYASIACPYAKRRIPCPEGDACLNAHNLYEYWLHPDRYRTELCQHGQACTRPVCFFAHNAAELRQLPPGLPPAELCWNTGAGQRNTTQRFSARGPPGGGPQQWAGGPSGGATVATRAAGQAYAGTAGPLVPQMLLQQGGMLMAAGGAGAGAFLGVPSQTGLGDGQPAGVFATLGLPQAQAGQLLAQHPHQQAHLQQVMFHQASPHQQAQHQQAFGAVPMMLANGGAAAGLGGAAAGAVFAPHGGGAAFWQQAAPGGGAAAALPAGSAPQAAGGEAAAGGVLLTFQQQAPGGLQRIGDFGPGAFPQLSSPQQRPSQQQLLAPMQQMPGGGAGAPGLHQPQ